VSRAEFLMSQIDLDPIESRYSQEQQQLSSNMGGLHSRVSRQIGDSANNIMRRTGTLGDGKQENTMNEGSVNSVSQGKSLGNSEKS